MPDEYDEYHSEKPSYEFQRIKRERTNRLLKRLVILIVALFVASFAAILILEEACGYYILFRSKDAWEMLTYRNETPQEVYSGVYYSGHVTKEQALKLGSLFERRGFFRRPDTVTMILSKKDDDYLVSFFVAGYFRIEDVRPEFEELRQAISREVLEGENVIIQLCEREVIAMGSHPSLRVRATVP